MLFGQSFFSIGLIASFSAAFANPGPKKSPAKLETVETKFPTDSGKVKKPQSKDKKAPLKEIEAEPQKGLRKVTPQPMLKQQPETITPKPDLKIEELKYVDNSRLKKVGVKKAAKPYISFIVKNAGKGKIDRGEFEKITLTVKIGGRSDARYKKLSQILSYHHIKEPGSLHRCEIPKRLDKRTRVELELNSSGAVDELRRDNNRVGILLGGPAFLKSEAMKEKGLTKKKGPQELMIAKPSIPSGKKMRTPSESVKAARTGEGVVIAKKEKAPGMKGGPMIMGAKLNLPEGQVPEPVPKSLDYGIQIVEPKRGQEPRRGTTIRLMYRVTNWQEAEAGDITFTLHPYGNRNEAPVATTSNGYTPPGHMQPVGLLYSIHWTLPVEISVNDNYVIVARLNDDIWGESDHFAIRHMVEPADINLSGQGNGIRVELPEGGVRHSAPVVHFPVAGDALRIGFPGALI